MGEAPGPEQLENLLKGFIRDEILYREALRAGLAANDDIVRGRLIQKIEVLTALEPSWKGRTAVILLLTTRQIRILSSGLRWGRLPMSISTRTMVEPRVPTRGRCKPCPY